MVCRLRIFNQNLNIFDRFFLVKKLKNYLFGVFEGIGVRHSSRRHENVYKTSETENMWGFMVKQMLPWYSTVKMP